MKVILDERGQLFPDVLVEAACVRAISEQRDFHIGGIFTLDVFRSQMLRYPKDARPQVEWVFYGTRVEMNDDLMRLPF